jgi:L-iditol 2-dehydrogenase
MKVVEITGPRSVRLVEKPMPNIAANYVLVKVMVAPLCNEYQAYAKGVYLHGDRPDSLGHEVAGEVVDASPDASVKPGDRVVMVCGMFSCGRCELCRCGYHAYCLQPEDPRQICGSDSGDCGFAQYTIRPDWMLEPIPDDLSYDHASLAACGLGPTFGAMDRTEVKAGQTVLITGLGAVGLGGIVNAKARGARVIGVVRTPYRAELARRLGCDLVIGPSLPDIFDATNGRGVDVALECSGQPEYQRLAIDAVARLGRIAFLAEPGRLSVRVHEDLVQRGIMLLGSVNINRYNARRLLEVIRSVPEQLDILVTHRLPLERIGEAFEVQAAYESGKILLYPWAVQR